ncbi:hypothetical protein ACFX4N_23580 [Priestia sp. YIM B13551]|uniref:hypothetical protein n=1 Tax=Priestia sp. YIM B13551 TaxID=3366306 RepID=UPI00366A8C91
MKVGDFLPSILTTNGGNDMTIATGQISIVDFNDAPSLSAFISTTSPKTQIYDPATTQYTPSWTTSSPTLVPSLFVSTQGNTDQIDEATVTWYDATAPDTALTSTAPYTITGNTLKISSNIMTGSVYSKTYIADIAWVDPATGATLHVKTEFTFNRANNGATGAAGANAVTAVLSNDTHTVPTDSAGNNGSFGGASTTMSIFIGSTDDSANWTVTAAAGTGVTGSLSGKTYTVTALSTDNGYVDLTAAKSGQPSITKRFTIVKNKQGVIGVSSTSYWLVSSAPALSKTLAGAYTPATLTFTGKSQTGSGTPADYAGRFIIAETTDGTTFTDKYTSSANEATKTYTPSAGVKAVRARLYLAGGTTTLIDEQAISVVSDGQTGASAVTAVLSNDAHTIPTDSAGNNGIFTGAVSTMAVYVGATDDSSNWTITAAPASGVTGTLSGKTYTVTAMTVDNGYVDLTAAKSGYTSVTKRFTLSKNKQGQSATAYWLVSSTPALSKNISGVYTPGTITVTGKSQVGQGSAADYAGRFIIAETTDGTTFTDKYTSSANEASKTYTPTAGIKAVRTRLYAAGGTTALLDEQLVTVVSDGATGATGADAVLVSTWAPSGNLFKNDLSTSLTAQADVYKGASVLTSGVTFEWYVQDPGAADGGGGAGWTKITTTNQASFGVTGSVTASTLTVASSGVTNLAAFKVKATYSSKSYFDTIIFYDQTDPIMVVVDSSNGVIFKNGNISSELVCRLYQNGSEIDPKKAPEDASAYKYTYTWTKFGLDGNQDLTFGGANGFKTGKSITITDADIYQKAVFKVEIS